MSKFWSILVIVIAMLSTSVASGGEPASEAELKARFKERLKPLESLKDAGKVGETTKGLVEVVAAEHKKDEVKLPKGTTTVGAFIGEENADRKKLYALIGKRTDESADEVAKQAAIRNFKKAKPDHYVKLTSGEWKKKKEVREPK